ncbi:MAG: tetratricopeptide repeat protein [Polyangiaceae bacterium]|jgi:tetratricopeptide (TPR) repeat protein
MAKTSKRLEFLLALAPTSADPMVGYGLAMEFRSLERYEEALAAFEALRTRTPTYVPMYLMCGLMLDQVGKADEAREWLDAGIEVARAHGDAHAVTELENARATVN